ncbi:PKD domain-containing protein [Maribellus sediminis]|uniref:PKD domain-containing protein n=1 Tax=Maribellus sediminis TaxID=2696285 RepID=UPI0014308718|nr:PKD domain-containing protein [Maribellus sediminis]
MKRSFYSVLTMLAVVALLFSSCSKDDPEPPVVEMFAEVDGSNSYMVNCTTNSTNATSFTWDFGDGETGTGASASHTYELSGEYTITVTATGDGGTATSSKSVTIVASMAELLSGGTASGKTWVLSRTATPGVDGAGSVDPSFPTGIMPGTDNLLDAIGLGAEYDNEFTFYADGSYSINNKDGNNMAGWIYSYSQIGEENIVIPTAVGIFSVTNTPSTNATWSLTENTDLVVDAVDEGAEGAFTPKTVTFTGADYLTFGNGGFIGIQDFSANALIRDISSDRMVVAIFLNSVYGAPDKPSALITVSFDAK